jgi:Thoeris protein ThsB, TIR-like domain
MANRVYFAFHYQDVIDFRANVVRNHWVTKEHRDDAGYFDKSLWEEAKSPGGIGLKRLINGGLENTSVTCVLIGSQTWARPWVRYELLKSFKRGNLLMGVHINAIAGKDQQTKPLGPNPLENLCVTYSANGQLATMWEWLNGAWAQYTEIDGSSSYAVNVLEQYRNKGFKLNQWYKTYDWVKDDGYNNFASWVG